MKIFNKIYIIALVGLLLATASCEKEFDEVNENPNNPLSVTPDLLLPNIIRSSTNRVTNESWSIGNIVAQHTAKIQFVNEDRYNWGERNDTWTSMYATLRDVYNMNRISSEAVPVQKNYQGISLVMKSWIFSVLTDTYGDVPYSEAIKGKEKEFLPKYDRQEDIYAGILADLKTANDELLGKSEESVGGDILFGGDVKKWQKFANSLRLRYLMRISNVKDVKAEIAEIVNNPAQNPIFEGNQDNAALTYLNAFPNQFPLYTSRVGSVDEFRLSKTLDDKLTALNDPRLQIFARPTVASVKAGNPEIVGVPNGLNDVEALEYNGGVQNISRIGSPFFKDSGEPITQSDIAIAKGKIMTYSELMFILAEAAQKGWIAGSAKEYYEKGIEGSFNYYGLTIPDGYLTQTEVNYNPVKGLEQIATQKWISLFYNGTEAWFDWRRTGLPALTPGKHNLNDNKIPVRYVYPSSEKSLNNNNLQEAILRQGADNINTPVWWDK